MKENKKYMTIQRMKITITIILFLRVFDLDLVYLKIFIFIYDPRHYFIVQIMSIQPSHV